MGAVKDEAEAAVGAARAALAGLGEELRRVNESVGEAVAAAWVMAEVRPSPFLPIHTIYPTRPIYNHPTNAGASEPFLNAAVRPTPPAPHSCHLFSATSS